MADVQKPPTVLEVENPENQPLQVENPEVEDYFYYDYVEEQNEERLSAICHEFEYSILFFLVVAVIGTSFTIYVILLATKRRNFIFYGFDILYSLMFLCAAIR